MNGSQILTEQFGNIFIVYLYDESGSPIGMQYRTKSMAEGTFYTYLFEKNLQGDIIAVYNTSGTKLVSYVYDAWGNVTVTNHNVSGTNTGARYNPFRYRGYYYDTETGYYYLQSRYYNPEWGRFLNADGYISTGQDILSYNMYIYCGNNPFNRVDYSGAFWEELGDWLSETGKKIRTFARNVAEDIINFDVNNTSEQVVLNSHYFSYYKGTFVIKLPIGKNAASFGIIILGSKVSNPDVVKHEYGHKVQFEKKGIVKYIFEVAIPSVTANILNRMGKLPYDYYGSPWEHEADIFGGVNRNATLWPTGITYWDLIEMF